MRKIGLNANKKHIYLSIMVFLFVFGVIMMATHPPELKSNPVCYAVGKDFKCGIDSETDKLVGDCEGKTMNELMEAWNG